MSNEGQIVANSCFWLKKKKKNVFDVIVSIVRTPDCMQVCEM